MKPICYIMQKCRLIFLDCNDIIYFLFNDFADNLLLAAHCICGHDRIFNVDQIQQFQHCGDLVCLFVHRDLSERDLII